MRPPTRFDQDLSAVRSERDVIRATGPDTEAFLQGQLSQDVGSIAVGASAYSFLLQPQGKVAAWLRVNRLAVDAFVLDVDAGFGDAALARLNRFKLRTDCDLTLDRWAMISVRGPGAEDLNVQPDSGTEVRALAMWPGTVGIDLLGSAVAVPTGISEATREDLEALRIMAGVPAMGAELSEATIPNETGVIKQSVSFTKGCFTGQELVARIDSRGANVARHLRGVRLEGPAEAGQVVVVGGVEVGVITSAVGLLALAYIKRSVESLPASAVVSGIGATVHALPLI